MEKIEHEAFWEDMQRTVRGHERIEQEIREEIDHLVLSQNRLGEWGWGSMAHSLKQGLPGHRHSGLSRVAQGQKPVPLA
jgi:hypothetical protein